MKKLTTLLLASALFVSFMGCEQKQKPAPQQSAQARIEYGKYLVTVGGCNDCHTPWKMGPNGPAPDQTRLLSGHPQDAPYPIWTPADAQRNAIMLAAGTNTAWAGPWGVSFTANLTSDSSTGLGEWQVEDFMRTLRSGKHQGQPNGRDILPPMPWFNYGKMTDDDLKAVWAYLRSIPPVKNQVPFPAPPGTPVSMAK